MSVFTVLKSWDKEKTGPAPIRWLVAGLGNPGLQYANTRHNAGFLCLDRYSEKTGLSLKRIKFKALIGEGMLGGEKILFLKPQTMMNLSGESVREAASFYQIPPERILVISDDISLPAGRLRVRAKGSDGGQKGLRSIIQQLGSDAFPRIRIGVGQKPHPDYDLAKWVLSPLRGAEAEAVGKAADQAMLAAEEVIRHGVPEAARKYNSSGK